MLHLFERDGFEIKINEEAYALNSMIALIKSNKGNEELLMNEVKFVFHNCDYRSQFDGQERSLRRENAIYTAGLGGDWTESKQVLALVTEYRHTLAELVPTTKLLSTGRQSINEVTASLETMVQEIRALRMVIEKAPTTPMMARKLNGQGKNGIAPEVKVQAAQEQRLIQLETLASLNKKVISMLGDLPDMIKSLEQILSQVKKEESEAIELRGGAKKGNREDP